MAGASRPLVRGISVLLLIMSLAVAETPAQTQEVFTYPAEWESHTSIWMGFRTFEDGLRFEPLLQEMLRTLSGYVPIRVVIEDERLLPEGYEYFQMIGADPERIEIVVEKNADFWFRDPGPIFLVSDVHRSAVANFSYSNYSNTPSTSLSPLAVKFDRLDENIAHELSLAAVKSPVVLEGGAFEVNGRGTVLLSASTLRRNPGRDKAEISAEVLRVLGQRKVIWLNEGLAEDPLGFARITGKYWGRGAGGHIDEFVRFVNGNTVLLAWVDEQERHDNPLNEINYVRMSENLEILRAATDQDGQPFTVIKFPVPSLQETPYEISDAEAGYFRAIDPALGSGEKIRIVAASSYLNYVVTNGVVLLPEYADARATDRQLQKDRLAKAIMEKYFPGRDIVQINPVTLNFHGGGMHCITVQQPDPG